MNQLPIDQFYNEQYYGHSNTDSLTRLPFKKADYYRKPLRRLCVQAREKFLDIACGDGRLLAHAESLGLQCWGIDISQVAVDRARSRCKADIIRADVNNGLPFQDKFFDYVTCLGSLEHFTNQLSVVREIHRVIKPSGRIYLLVPNQDYILHKFGYETDNQPVINRYSLAVYRNLLAKGGLTIDCVLRDNSHISNLAESSSLLKLLLKLIVHPIVGLIPLHFSYNFIFLCRPDLKAIH